MKTISREEFRDAYLSPTEEQTARMQAKLDSLQADPEDRRRFLSSRPRRMAFVMAAVLLAAGVITAVATNITTRYATTWGGEVKEYVETTSDAAQDAWYEGIPEEMLEKKAKAEEEGYFAYISGNEKGVFTLPTRECESEEQLIATLDTEGFPHPAALIPEGYRFITGSVSIDTRSSFDPDTCVGCMFSPPYSLYIYAVEPEDQYISSCDVYFADEKDPNSRYHIGFNLSQSKEGTFFFYTDEAYTTQALSVPGMEEAFSVRTQEEEELHMCRSIREDPVYLSGKLADLKFRYQRIDANGPIDDILKVFEGWK
jgi:hypothetical protein